ncbi:MAG TPA: DUF3667 domain-containing protein [Flavitalea sp.]|nr:DUF3667 domain-containing protein [Flavitalea sp.]
MSHRKERTEKNCLNCDTEVAGRFCQNCGQENIEPKENAWHLIHHFISDITHFDGKFFQSVGLLFRKPGFLSKQYVLGRRASYLNPVRMYVFTSALFFLVFFAAFSATDMTSGLDRAGRINNDSIEVAVANQNHRVDVPRKPPGAVSSEQSIVVLDSAENDFLTKIKTVPQYDSMQAALPAAEKDGWLKRLVISRGLMVNSKYSGDRKEIVRELVDHFLHTLPYILFISLPLYALFLKLLYIRHKEYYYADHGIFLVHLYIFTFIFFLVLIGLSKLQDRIHLGGMGWFYGLLVILGIYYAFKAMRNFYLQSSSKTMVKFLLFNFLCLNSIGFLFLISLMVSVFRL